MSLKADFLMKLKPHQCSEVGEIFFFFLLLKVKGMVSYELQSNKIQFFLILTKFPQCFFKPGSKSFSLSPKEMQHFGQNVTRHDTNKGVSSSSSSSLREKLGTRTWTWSILKFLHTYLVRRNSLLKTPLSSKLLFAHSMVCFLHK